MIHTKLQHIILISLLIVTGCNTRYRLNQAYQKVGSVNVRQPLRSEKKEQTDSASLPKSIVIKDKDGKESMILEGTKDGDDYLYSFALQGVEVVAKSKTVPERNGKITISFVVCVPAEFVDTDWRLTVRPSLTNKDSVQRLAPVVLTGKNYLQTLNRKYFYDNKVSYQTLKWDIKLLERRNALDPYVFNDNQEVDSLKRLLAAWEHGLPAHESWMLDSVVHSSHGLEYYYNQEFKTEDLATKLKLSFTADIQDMDGTIYPLPEGDTLNYFISSMMQFLDRKPRYVRKVIYRKVTETTSCYINFPVGSVVVSDTLGNNRSELGKVAEKMREINNGNEFVIDSIVLVASSSPEGLYSLNAQLAAGRAASLHGYLKPVLESNAEAVELVKERPMAENWEKLTTLIKQKGFVYEEEILDLLKNTDDADQREFMLRQKFPEEYETIREQLYPELRAVDFVFHLSRRGMVEDVMYTDVIDTAYAEALALMDRRKYKEAMPKLLEYRDWNCAICYMSLGYNDTAIKLFEQQNPSADRDYMLAILYARVGKTQEAVDTYLRCCQEDESKIDRGELDPEISQLINRYNLREKLYN